MLTGENLRFIEVIDMLKNDGQVTDYVQLAATLGTNKASISDIKSGRKKISIELLRRLKISYPAINLDWIIMGEGEMFIPTQHVEVKQAEAPDYLINMVKEKDQTIREQAEELGRLRQQLAHAHHEYDVMIAKKATFATPPQPHAETTTVT